MRLPGYDNVRLPGYDNVRLPGYDNVRLPGYDTKIHIVLNFIEKKVYFIIK